MAKDEDVQREAARKQQKKSELERTAEANLGGGPQLKQGEKNKFLGEYKERVLIALTYEQVEEPGTYKQVLEAIKDQEATKLIINRKVDMDRAKDYIRLASENDLSFKKVAAANYKGDIALVVVSDHAVHRDNIFVKSRAEKFKERGIPVELIDATGKKICEDCYNLIKEKAPEEVENYKKMTLFDKLTGIKCPVDHN
ncbi:MAG: YueI family protein [Bacillota bacterium]